MDVRRTVLAVMCLAGTLVAGYPAAVTAGGPPAGIEELSEEERGALKSHMRRGREAYDNGEFETSLSEFQQARDILDHPEFTYRIALSHERLGHLRKAVEAYRRYLELAPETDERGKVERTIAELEKRIEAQRPVLEVATSPAGAEIRIDGESESRTTTPASLTLTVGRHAVELRKQGFRTVERTIELARGQTLSMEVDLEETADPEVEAAADEPTDTGGASDEPSDPRIGPIITLGAGGALAVGSVVSYLQFAGVRRDIEQAHDCGEERCPEPDNFGQMASRAKRWDRITWTLGSLAVATATTGAIWMAVGGGEAGDGRRASSRWRIAPMVGADRVGLQLRVRPR